MQNKCKLKSKNFPTGSSLYGFFSSETSITQQRTHIQNIISFIAQFSSEYNFSSLKIPFVTCRKSILFWSKCLEQDLSNQDSLAGLKVLFRHCALCQVVLLSSLTDSGFLFNAKSPLIHLKYTHKRVVQGQEF